MENENKKIKFYCIWCKDPIYEGESYYTNEDGDKLHEFGTGAF